MSEIIDGGFDSLRHADFIVTLGPFAARLQIPAFGCGTSYIFIIIHSHDVSFSTAGAMITQVSAIIIKVFAKC